MQICRYEKQSKFLKDAKYMPENAKICKYVKKKKKIIK